MYLILYSFAGQPKHAICYAKDREEVEKSFNTLKKELEKDHNQPFQFNSLNDSYMLTGSDHDGYNISYTASPIKHIDEIMR